MENSDKRIHGLTMGALIAMISMASATAGSLLTTANQDGKGDDFSPFVPAIELLEFGSAAYNNHIAIAWSLQGTAHFFEVERRYGSYGSPVVENFLVSGEERKLFQTDILACQGYYYRVRAHGDLGPGDWSEEKFVGSIIPTPAAPSDLRVVGTGINSDGDKGTLSVGYVDLTWKDNAGNEDGFVATGYSEPYGSGFVESWFYGRDLYQSRMYIYSAETLRGKRFHLKLKSFNCMGYSGASNEVIAEMPN